MLAPAGASSLVPHRRTLDVVQSQCHGHTMMVSTWSRRNVGTGTRCCLNLDLNCLVPGVRCIHHRAMDLDDCAQMDITPDLNAYRNELLTLIRCMTGQPITLMAFRSFFLDHLVRAENLLISDRSRQDADAVALADVCRRLKPPARSCLPSLRKASVKRGLQLRQRIREGILDEHDDLRDQCLRCYQVAQQLPGWVAEVGEAIARCPAPCDPSEFGLSDLPTTST